MVGADQRQQLGTFLRSRRERRRPEDVGLPPGGRRRTPGLRREEVATLAAVSVTWYTWLEQGRDVHPSRQVLTSLADVLRLDRAERECVDHHKGLELRLDDEQSRELAPHAERLSKRRANGGNLRFPG